MNKGASEKNKYLVWSLSSLAILVSGTFLLLWIFGGEAWRPFVGWRLKFNTALGLSAAGVALALLSPREATGRYQIVGRVLSLFAIAIGAATLVEYYASLDLGIDELFLPDVRNAESAQFPGRMAPNSALGILLVGASLFLIDLDVRWRKFALNLALLASALGLFCLIGYLFDAQLLYQPTAFIRMSPYTAVVVLMISVAIILARPRLGLVRLLLSETSVGAMARRMFIAAIFLPLLIGWLFAELQRNSVMDSATANALTALVTIFALLGFVWVKTERIWRAEEEIKKSKQRFRTMANSIPQIAWVANPSGEVVWINRRGYEYLDVSLGDVLGADFSSVHHPDHIRRVMEKFRVDLQAGEPWEDTFPMRGRGGEWRWFLTRAVPVHAESGDVTSWFGTNTDITEKLETEKALNKSKEAAEKASMAKTHFLANISHELRTPVGAITGFVDLLKQSGLSSLDRENYLAIVERNARHLLSLIDDILDLSKIEAGKIAVETALIDLTEFFDDFESTMRLRANEKGIQLRVTAATLVPDRFRSDPVRLRQVLANVVGNAIKFTEAGVVELNIAFESSRLSFCVRDTGIGICAEAVPELFRPFAQADAAANRRYGGTGLGLVLSKRICQALGGDLVLVETEPGVGSAFKATVPGALPSDVSMIRFGTVVVSGVHRPALQDRTQGALQGTRILVVDDSLDNRLLISTYLSRAGADVLTADDGEEGFKRALGGSPDLILMDIQMPKLDGYEATRRLRSQGFIRPILALTAHAMRDERDRCLAAGCCGYITKPVRREKLIETVLSHLKLADYAGADLRGQRAELVRTGENPAISRGCDSQMSSL